MKNTFVKLRNLAILFVIAALVSCEGPEGPKGPTGPKGDKGDPGPTGPGGNDGNSNVSTISLPSDSITWVEGEYLGRIANTFSISDTLVNDDIINHGTVLGYCFMFEAWYPLPITWEDADGTGRQYIVHSYSPNTITLYAYETTGVLDPSMVSEYRFMLITDNTVLSGKGEAGTKDIITRLKESGVDVNSYYQVMDYFGLKY